MAAEYVMEVSGDLGNCHTRVANRVTALVGVAPRASSNVLAYVFPSREAREVAIETLLNQGPVYGKEITVYRTGVIGDEVDGVAKVWTCQCENTSFFLTHDGYVICQQCMQIQNDIHAKIE